MGVIPTAAKLNATYVGMIPTAAKFIATAMRIIPTHAGFNACYVGMLPITAKPTAICAAVGLFNKLCSKQAVAQKLPTFFTVRAAFLAFRPVLKANATCNKASGRHQGGFGYCVYKIAVLVIRNHCSVIRFRF